MLLCGPQVEADIAAAGLDLTEDECAALLRVCAAPGGAGRAPALLARIGREHTRLQVPTLAAAEAYFRYAPDRPCSEGPCGGLCARVDPHGCRCRCLLAEAEINLQCMAAHTVTPVIPLLAATSHAGRAARQAGPGWPPAQARYCR